MPARPGEPVEPDPVSTGVGSRSMTVHTLAGVVLGAMATNAVALPPESGPLEEIVISASLRPTPLAEGPQRVTGLDRATLAAAGVQPFEDVLGLGPARYWASAPLRPRD